MPVAFGTGLFVFNSFLMPRLIHSQAEVRVPDLANLTLEQGERLHRRLAGERLRVDTSDAGLRSRFAEAAAVDRRQVADELAAARASHVVLSTEGDWLRELAAHLGGRRR